MARLVLIGGVFAVALPGSLGYIRFLWREHTPVLNLPLDLVYSCFGVFLVAVILRAAISAVRAARRALARRKSERGGTVSYGLWVLLVCSRSQPSSARRSG